MRVRYLAATVMIATLVAAAILWKFIQAQPPDSVYIQMTSAPFPMVVGPTTLAVSLTDADGQLVENAQVEVLGIMSHGGPSHGDLTQGGVMSMTGQANSATDGLYQMSIMWPMAGPWSVVVAATLPDQRTVQEQFDIYIYPVPPAVSGGQPFYRSLSEIKAMVTANPAREYWIVIPQGTQALMQAGVGEDVIPPELRLSLSGKNTLIIRNDDIANHNIGPFFVRAGETVRQEFTQPAVFEGTCSIRHQGNLNLVVEE